jgi:Fe2+ transport system protein FeoA
MEEIESYTEIQSQQDSWSKAINMNSHELLPVERLSSGVWADVEEIRGETSWVSRLAELGVRAGSRLKVLQPGSPCLLQVGGSRLSLRAESAKQILVRPVPLT